MTSLFIFGAGYTSREIARMAIGQGWQVAGTTRSANKLDDLSDIGITPIVFDETLDATGQSFLANAAVILVSIPPRESGDSALGIIEKLKKRSALSAERITYLSSLSVYGDFGGAWIDETALTNPNSTRGKERVAAENQWRELGTSIGAPVDILRLAGIYGPGRNTLERLLSGKAKRIVGTDHIFNRIHLEDIARLTFALMEADAAGGTYNLCDDEPASQNDVVTFAAGLLGVEPPPATALQDAELSAMGRSFYEENKRVRNAKILKQTGMQLRFPTYREGLTALSQTLR